MTEQTVATDTTGPITLDLQQDTGTITIVVDPKATTATVNVSTTDTDGPIADAVRNTRINQAGARLTVRVPEVPSTAGGTVINGRGGVIITGGITGRIIVNGVDVTAAARQGNGGQGGDIATTVTLPPGSDAFVNSLSAATIVRGHLEALDYGSSSGSLRADSIGGLDLGMTSGDAHVGVVTTRLNANLTSGNLNVDSYRGREARVNLTSGNARMHATPESSGRLAVGLTSGNGTFTGTSHLDVSRRRSSGYLRVS